MSRTRLPVHLVMPMAGLGSRFSAAGWEAPKPLLPLAGEPFFWWAAESVRRAFHVHSMTFVVLREHVNRFGIDRAVLDRYPAATVVSLPEPTAGALETAVAGCRVAPSEGWLVVNDCDQAFSGHSLASDLASAADGADGFLLHFRSRAPSYSYASYDGAGRLLRTVEKEVISDLAISGAYGFRDRATFLRHADSYVLDCPYPELFMSGVYNTLVAAGGEVRGVVLDRHLSFGTPAEYAAAPAALGAMAEWPPAGAGAGVQ